MTAFYTIPEVQHGFFESILLDSLRAALTETVGDQGAKALIYHLRLREEISVPLIHARLRNLLGTDGALVVDKLVIEQFRRKLGIPREEPTAFDFEALLLKAVLEFSQTHMLIHNGTRF